MGVKIACGWLTEGTRAAMAGVLVGEYQEVTGISKENSRC
jgi:hypothetical protein